MFYVYTYAVSRLRTILLMQTSLSNLTYLHLMSWYMFDAKVTSVSPLRPSISYLSSSSKTGKIICGALLKGGWLRKTSQRSYPIASYLLAQPLLISLGVGDIKLPLAFVIWLWMIPETVVVLHLQTRVCQGQGQGVWVLRFSAILFLVSL